MLVQVKQCKMHKCTMHMHNATTKPRKPREEKINPTKLPKEKSAIKRGNKPQAPLASEQSLCDLYHDCLTESGTGYRCVWFWSVG